MDLVETAKRPFVKGLISGLFLTGCRVSELNQLRKEQFRLDIHPELILVERAPVIKRYSRKTGERYTAYRTFPIKRSEPLVPYLLDWLDEAPQRPFGYSRSRIFQLVRRTGELLNRDVPFSRIHSSQLYPHWFRAQRARQLRHDYKFTDEELRDWFGWKYAKSKERMPSIYGRSSWIELAEKMGVKIGYY